MSSIPKKKDNPEGLHQKYSIRKIVGVKKDAFSNLEYLRTKATEPNAEYFVLRLDTGGTDWDHLRACRAAIQVYAREIQHKLPKLAQDLRERYPHISHRAE